MPHRIPNLDTRLAEQEKKFDAVVQQRNWALVSALCCLAAAIAGIFVAIDSRSTARHSDTVAKQSRQVANELKQANLIACRRGNVSRVSRIGNYEKDILGARADIRFAQSFEEMMPDPRPLKRYIDEKLDVIEGKQDSIQEELDSASEFAIASNHPVINCEKAYP